VPAIFIGPASCRLFSYQEMSMPLPVNHPLREEVVQAFSRSIGASPEAAFIRAPFRGRVVKVGCVTQGAITTADASIATAINGTAITGGAITVTQSGAAAGQHFSVVPSAARDVVEDDVVSFTPSGASGASIGGQLYAVFERA
jgi:hypothetical protein